jgi:hypothetical protein
VAINRSPTNWVSSPADMALALVCGAGIVIAASASSTKAMLNDNPVRRELLNRAFQRRLIKHDKFTRIRSICKNCGAQFVGNAEPVQEWEDIHFDTCKARIEN